MRKRYPSDLTDEQWEALKPLLPPARPGGRPRTADLREVLNTLFYQARTGCQWDYLPHDLVPKSTARDYFDAWRKDGTWQKLVDALRRQVRTAEGREAAPSAAAIDTQSVKTTEMGGVRGWDGGKRVNGRKRHIVVDTLGLLLAVAVTTAKADDGTAAPGVLAQLSAEQRSRLQVIWADGKYHNDTLRAWLRQRRVRYRVEVVSRPDGVRGFVLLPKRWVVERTWAWLGRYRRLGKDWEYETGVSEAWVRVCAVHQMARRMKPDRERQQPPLKYKKESRKAVQEAQFVSV
jgi:putative transposase